MATCAARLVHRSTQGLSLTAEGVTFLGYCQRLTGTLEELEGEFTQHAQTVRGRMRVAASARHRLPKIRACIDHWAAWLGQDTTIIPA